MRILRNIGCALLLACMATGHAAPTPPDEVVKGAVTRVQDLIAKNHVKYRADMPAFYQMVDREVVPLFDVRFIAQLVLGRPWRDASDEQRARFAEAFKNMLIRSYANAMLEYQDSVKVEWKPLRMAPDAKDTTVFSALQRDGKPPVPVGFVMRLSGKDSPQWKIYDITVENISLVTNFRGQIAAEVKKSGLDAVIARLEKGELQPDADRDGKADAKSAT
jgi:phospholipid transport system substrate-binding protein